MLIEDEVEAVEEVNPTEEDETWDLYTYQLRYVADDGEVVTNLIEATHVHTDDDHVEIWDHDILLFMIQRHSVQQLRNVSELDMRLL